MITEIRMRALGCVILRASAHLLREKLLNRTLGEAFNFIQMYENSFIHSKNGKDLFVISELATVYSIPNRYQCALLPAKALYNFLSQRSRQ